VGELGALTLDYRAALLRYLPRREEVALTSARMMGPPGAHLRRELATS
jgi:hypothetical protein